MKRQNAELLGEVLKRFVASNHLEPGLLRHRVFAAFDRIVDPSDGRSVVMKSFSEKILICYLNSSIVKHKLFTCREEIVRKINIELGEEALSNIIFK